MTISVFVVVVLAQALDNRNAQASKKNLFHDINVYIGCKLGISVCYDVYELLFYVEVLAFNQKITLWQRLIHIV